MLSDLDCTALSSLHSFRTRAKQTIGEECVFCNYNEVYCLEDTLGLPSRDASRADNGLITTCSSILSTS